jgi:hypothetical protein
MYALRGEFSDLLYTVQGNLQRHLVLLKRTTRLAVAVARELV